MFDDVVYKDKYIWQCSKNEINIREHEISFEAASLGKVWIQWKRTKVLWLNWTERTKLRLTILIYPPMTEEEQKT